MVTVIPAILTNNADDLAQKVAMVASGADTIHIDVMDGVYVHNVSLSLDGIAAALAPIDFSSKIELHLMCENPITLVEEITHIKNIYAVIVHEDAAQDLPATINAFRLKQIRVGLSIPLNQKIPMLTASFDYFLVLAEDEPGYSGTPFNMDALDRIAQIKTMYPNKVIEVDGGINDITGRICIRHGADILVANSYIFKSDDPVQRLHSLESLQEAYDAQPVSA